MSRIFLQSYQEEAWTSFLTLRAWQAKPREAAENGWTDKYSTNFGTTSPYIRAQSVFVPKYTYSATPDTHPYTHTQTYTQQY